MSNLTFDVKCVRKDPQAGICEILGNCDLNDYSQSTQITLIQTSGQLLSGLVQHLNGVCHLSLTFFGAFFGGVLATLPPGFFPTSIVTVPAIGMPSNLVVTLQIDLVGNIILTSGATAGGDTMTVNIAYTC